MLTHPAAYEEYVAQLLATPDDSVDHHIAVAVATCATSEALEKLLFAMVTEDPAGSVEYRIAGHLIALLFPAVTP
jgi:hypothetical protein